MIQGTKALVRRWLNTLLHIEDTPQRTARAFALGVFFGFSPFLGLHTLLGILFAFLLNLNRVAVVVGIYSNLPWIIAPYYVLVTTAGAAVTGGRIPPGFGRRLEELFQVSVLHREFWTQLGVILRPLLWPYAVGSFFGAILLALVAYPLALAFITSRRRLTAIIHKHGEP